MIKEDYVSFKIAKLLEEKGFNESVEFVWYEKCPVENTFFKEDVGKPKRELFYLNSKTEVNTPFKNGDIIPSYICGKVYAAPTIQIVRKWLKEVHNIFLVVDYEYECDTTPYYFKIYRLGENGKPERVAIKGVSYDKDGNAVEHIAGYCDWERSKDDYSNEEQAYEAGIRYCLENLI